MSELATTAHDAPSPDRAHVRMTTTPTKPRKLVGESLTERFVVLPDDAALVIARAPKHALERVPRERHVDFATVAAAGEDALVRWSDVQSVDLAEGRFQLRASGKTHVFTLERSRDAPDLWSLLRERCPELGETSRPMSKLRMLVAPASVFLLVGGLGGLMTWAIAAGVDPDADLGHAHPFARGAAAAASLRVLTRIALAIGSYTGPWPFALAVVLLLVLVGSYTRARFASPPVVLELRRR